MTLAGALQRSSHSNVVTSMKSNGHAWSWGSWPQRGGSPTPPPHPELPTPEQVLLPKSPRNQNSAPPSWQGWERAARWVPRPGSRQGFVELCRNHFTLSDQGFLARKNQADGLKSQPFRAERGPPVRWDWIGCTYWCAKSIFYVQNSKNNSRPKKTSWSYQWPTPFVLEVHF